MAILVGTAEPFRHFRSLRITAAKVLFFLWVHRYKSFNTFLSFLIYNCFIKIGDFAIQIFLKKNIILVPCLLIYGNQQLRY